jgi:hypothetical protein
MAGRRRWGWCRLLDGCRRARHAAGSCGGADAAEFGARDHLDIVGAPPAYPAVGNADDGKALSLRLVDRMAGGMKNRECAVPAQRRRGEAAFLDAAGICLILIKRNPPINPVLDDREIRGSAARFS